MKPSSRNAVSTSSSSSKLSKLQAKPKIRIIQMIPPEVIETSVDDFCEIVQRLTGKPVADGGRSSSSNVNHSNWCPMKRQDVETTQDPMYNMLQRGFINNNKEKSDDAFSGGAWMNEFYMQDLTQFPLEVEDIIDVFSKDTAG